MRLLALLFVTFLNSLPGQALAFHEIFDRSPGRLKEYFGSPTAIAAPTIEENGESQWQEYDNAALVRLLPQLPRQSQFRIQYINGKARTVTLIPQVQDSGFAMSANDFQVLFRYVFGFGANRFAYQPIPFEGMGHEGFQEFLVCMGAGVALHYIEYRLGILDLSLTYNQLCE